jgi:hypothetical protein
MIEDYRAEPALHASSAVESQHLAMERLRARYQRGADGSPLPPLVMSDGEKYRWIRANRGNLAIEDALRYSDRDADFDKRIAAAIRMSAAGRNYFAFEPESPLGSSLP